MRDRRPGIPHRYAEYSDPELAHFVRYTYLVLDDAPTAQGMPLCKATLLDDQTAAALGNLPADPTPNDALMRLATLTSRDIKILSTHEQMGYAGQPSITLTLGTGYRAYLLELDLVSTGGHDVNLKMVFGGNSALEINKAGAVHDKAGRHCRILMIMVPGSYPIVQLVDADKNYSPSYGLAIRDATQNVDWGPYMTKVVLTATGASFARGSKARAVAWI